MLIRKMRKNGNLLITGCPGCYESPLKKLTVWHVDLVVITEDIAHIERFHIPGTRTAAVHYATIQALENNNYNCKISPWFRVSRN